MADLSNVVSFLGFEEPGTAASVVLGLRGPGLFAKVFAGRVDEGGATIPPSDRCPESATFGSPTMTDCAMGCVSVVCTDIGDAEGAAVVVSLPD